MEKTKVKKTLVYESEHNECDCNECDKHVKIYHIDAENYKYVANYYNKYTSGQWNRKIIFKAENDSVEELLKGLKNYRNDSTTDQINTFSP
jgi:hypothetical protein